MGTNDRPKAGIVESAGGCTLLGGGRLDLGDLEMALGLAPELICADGGADTALAAGFTPKWILGDMDSLSDQAKKTLQARIWQIENEDTTDFEKCLGHIQAGFLLCLGFLGKRLDHELTALMMLARFPQQKAILVGEEDICFLCPTDLWVRLPNKSRFSLVPLANTVASSDGLRWPLAGLALNPVSQLSTSNEVDGSEVRVKIKSGSALVVLPKQGLKAALFALTGRHIHGQPA